MSFAKVCNHQGREEEFGWFEFFLCPKTGDRTKAELFDEFFASHRQRKEHNAVPFRQRAAEAHASDCMAVSETWPGIDDDADFRGVS
jgi:hypothetical protein